MHLSRSECCLGTNTQIFLKFALKKVKVVTRSCVLFEITKFWSPLPMFLAPLRHCLAPLPDCPAPLLSRWSPLLHWIITREVFVREQMHRSLRLHLRTGPQN